MDRGERTSCPSCMYEMSKFQPRHGCKVRKPAIEASGNESDNDNLLQRATHLLQELLRKERMFLHANEPCVIVQCRC
eukprot:305747-Pleurochrysis_carterae.AAC.2